MIAVAWSEPQPDTPPQPIITLRSIIEKTALEYGLTVAQILARRRHRHIVYARQCAMWRCQKETSASLPEIGRAFGDFDHTTVLHGIRAHEERLKEMGDGAANKPVDANLLDRISRGYPKALHP